MVDQYEMTNASGITTKATRACLLLMSLIMQEIFADVSFIVILPLAVLRYLLLRRESENLEW